MDRPPNSIATIEPAAVLADKAYDSNALLAYIEAKKAKTVIPPMAKREAQRENGRYQYRNRNVIERFFARIKQFRRIATRYDKLAYRFASFVHSPLPCFGCSRCQYALVDATK